MNGQIVDVKLSELEIDGDFNSRTKYEMIPELAERIKAEGQIVPCAVTLTGNPKKPYKLRAGFRRAMAVKHLGDRALKCIVHEEIKSERDAFMVNVSENLARENLTTYETALALTRMRKDYGMTAKEIQSFLSVSKGYGKSNINNLISAIENLHPKILKAWQEEHPACTRHNLDGWKGMEHDEQLAEFAEAAALKIQGDSGDDEGGETSSSDSDSDKPKARKVSRVLIEEALTAAKGSDAKGAEYAIEALRFALGKVVKLKIGDTVVFDPGSAEKEAAKLKEEEKRAKLEAKEAKKAEIARIKQEALEKIAKVKTVEA